MADWEKQLQRTKLGVLGERVSLAWVKKTAQELGLTGGGLRQFCRSESERCGTELSKRNDKTAWLAYVLATGKEDAFLAAYDTIDEYTRQAMQKRVAGAQALRRPRKTATDSDSVVE